MRALSDCLVTTSAFREGGDLRQVRDAEHLVAGREPAQCRAHQPRRPAAYAFIDFVEDDGAGRRAASEHGSEREEEPRRLAAAGNWRPSGRGDSPALNEARNSTRSMPDSVNARGRASPSPASGLAVMTIS